MRQMRFDEPEIRVIVTSAGVESVQVVSSRKQPKSEEEALDLYRRLMRPIDKFTQAVKKSLAEIDKIKPATEQTARVGINT